MRLTESKRLVEKINSENKMRRQLWFNFILGLVVGGSCAYSICWSIDFKEEMYLMHLIQINHQAAINNPCNDHPLMYGQRSEVLIDTSNNGYTLSNVKSGWVGKSTKINIITDTLHEHFDSSMFNNVLDTAYGNAHNPYKFDQ